MPTTPSSKLKRKSLRPPSPPPQLPITERALMKKMDILSNCSMTQKLLRNRSTWTGPPLPKPSLLPKIQPWLWLRIPCFMLSCTAASRPAYLRNPKTWCFIWPMTNWASRSWFFWEPWALCSEKLCQKRTQSTMPTWPIRKTWTTKSSFRKHSSRADLWKTLWKWAFSKKIIRLLSQAEQIGRLYEADGRIRRLHCRTRCQRLLPLEGRLHHFWLIRWWPQEDFCVCQKMQNYCQIKISVCLLNSLWYAR